MTAVDWETCPWSIAIQPEVGILAAMVRPGLPHDEAALIADDMSTLTLKMVRPGITGPDGYQTVTGVNRLIYRHPDKGWIFAAVGHAFAVVVEVTVEPTVLVEVETEPKRGRR